MAMREEKKLKNSLDPLNLSSSSGTATSAGEVTVDRSQRLAGTAKEYRSR
jgi:hypothetical protein